MSFLHAVGKLLSTRQTLHAKRAYELWASNYDSEKSNPLLLIEEKILLPLLAQLDFANKSVIDFGCGTGRYFQYLLDHQVRNVVGVDFSRAMLLQAKRKYQEPRISLIESDLSFVPLQDSGFDIGLSTLVLAYLPDLPGAMKEINRVMRKGAILLISDFHPDYKQQGWKRNFTVSQGHFPPTTYNIRHFNYSIQDYQEAFAASNFGVDFMKEPRIDQIVEEVFHGIQMTEVYKRYFGAPILIVFQLRKR